jgi:DNA-binding beta-propeller fold protein YncE
VADTAYFGLTRGGVIAVDTVSGRERSPVAGLDAIRDIAITPDGRTVYVIDFGSEGWTQVTPIDTAANTPEAAIAVGEGASGLAVSPGGRTVLVTSTAAGTVTPISTETNIAGPPIAVDRPTGIAITPDGATAYVLTAGATLTLIDLTTNTTRAAIALGHTGQAIAITPDGTLALVGETDEVPSSPQSYVQVVDLPTGEAEAPVAISDDRVVTSLAIAPDGETAYIGQTVTFVDLTRPVESGGVVPFAIASRTAGSLISSELALWGGVHDVAVSGDSASLFGTVPCNSIHCTTGFGFKLDTATKTKADDFGFGGFDAQPAVIALVPGPSATFTATARRNESPSSFDAAASSNSGGAVTGYAWQFGDSSPAEATASATVSHTYARPGTYTVTLTTSNAGGCAARVVYTGQTASCTGSRTATTTRTVTVPAPGAHSGSARAVGRTRATLNGTIDAASDGASRHFVYGASKQYGRATRDRTLHARDGKVTVRSTLTRLAPNRRYHYRLIVETPSGTSDKPVISAGQDRTFKTRPTGTLHLNSGKLRLVRTTTEVPMRCASRRACRGRLSLTIRSITCGHAGIHLAAGQSTHQRITVRPTCRSLLKHANHHTLAGKLTSRLRTGQRGFNTTVRLAR